MGGGMSTARTYLDYNATAPLRPEARAAMLAALDVVGNPSSVHAEGREARALVEAAREDVAHLVGASPTEVVLTSGGTEAANMVMHGRWGRILVSAIEHPAVTAPARASGAEVVELPVTRDGVIDLDAADRLISAPANGPGRALVAVQAANNETGAIQPVAEIARMARANGHLVVADAVQAAGKISLDIDSLGVDALILSGHKIGAAKGVGALVVRGRAGFAPLMLGGGQERGARGGTENVAGIAGFGAAARAAGGELAVFAGLARLRDEIEAGVRAITPSAIVAAAAAPRLANTSLLVLPGRRGETLVIALDLGGIAVSAGAACSSGKTRRSPVLAAMGFEESMAAAAIRVSLGWASTEDDVTRFLAAWAQVTAAAKAA
jgi:cysteine desulfurase